MVPHSTTEAEQCAWQIQRCEVPQQYNCSGTAEVAKIKQTEWISMFLFDSRKINFYHLLNS
jgi:hypothetical protein